jgi:hypothetical protein
MSGSVRRFMMMISWNGTCKFFASNQKKRNTQRETQTREELEGQAARPFSIKLLRFKFTIAKYFPAVACKLVGLIDLL